VKAVYSPEHLRHGPEREVADGRQIGIFEIPDRAETIRAALEDDGGFELVEPAEHGPEPITAVHDPAMLDFLERIWADWLEAEQSAPEILPDTFPLPAYRDGMGVLREPATPRGRIGRWCFDTATPIVEGTYPAARAAVDVALSAAAFVTNGDRFAYGLCRPPGHHAARGMFGGYCYFNNAAIVAERLVRETGGRVAILDVDYHHGNGTQQLFYDRGDVLYVSLHGDPDRAYPYFSGFAEETGAGEGEGRTVNLPAARPVLERRLPRGARSRLGGDRRLRGRPRDRIARHRHVRAGADLRPGAHDRCVPRGRPAPTGARPTRRRAAGGRLLRPAPRRERSELAPRPPGSRPRPLEAHLSRRSRGRATGQLVRMPSRCDPCRVRTDSCGRRDSNPQALASTGI
jgi:acetoin utilization deacetylase AcuC-like enzyme